MLRAGIDAEPEAELDALAARLPEVRAYLASRPTYWRELDALVDAAQRCTGNKSGDLFKSARELAWWSNWATGLVVDLLDETIPKPIGVAIKAIASAGEHIADIPSIVRKERSSPQQRRPWSTTARSSGVKLRATSMVTSSGSGDELMLNAQNTFSFFTNPSNSGIRN